MQNFISPHFPSEALEPPTLKAMIDVFEDRMRYWLIEPVKALLTIQHGQVAAVALATNYIDGIEIYLSGKDSTGKSPKFFRRGFKKIFPASTGPDYVQDGIANALYAMLRCGFAHDGMFRNGIYFTTVRKEPILVTWPKKNGKFDPDGVLESAVINPKSYLRCIELHFNGYIKELRARKANDAQERFRAAVHLKWSIGTAGAIIGLTEEEFRSGA